MYRSIQFQTTVRYGNKKRENIGKQRERERKEPEGVKSRKKTRKCRKKRLLSKKDVYQSR